MPITQSRMHHLIQAAEIALTLHDQLREAIRQCASDAAHKRQTWEQAFATLETLAEVQITRNARLIISEERLRYNFTHKRNARVAGNKAAARGYTVAEAQLKTYTREVSSKQKLLDSRNASQVPHAAISFDHDITKAVELGREGELELDRQHLDLGLTDDLDNQDDSSPIGTPVDTDLTELFAMPAPPPGLSQTEQRRLDAEVERALQAMGGSEDED